MSIQLKHKCPCGANFWFGGGIVRVLFEDGEHKDVRICPDCCKMAHEISKKSQE